MIESELGDWIVAQRWYTGKGGSPAFRSIGSWPLVSTDPDVRIETHLVIDESQLAPALYQVPLSYRKTPIPELSPAYELDGVLVYDAPRDPAYAAALFDLMRDGGSVFGTDVTLAAHPTVAAPSASVVNSRVLSGEQSNTSIILDLVSSDGRFVPPAICKVFRALHHGENPDVVLQSAIAGAGSGRVPTSYSSLAATWPDVGRTDGLATGHLAFVQEFLPGTEDAWRVALRAVETNSDFSAQARALGAATAEVHLVLSEALPTIEPTKERVGALLAGMRVRKEAALAAAPSLRLYSDDIDAVYASAEEVAWPRLQRIHGDYHLGQVLLSPDRGWILVYFEGEPLRSMAERSLPDVALRDVAGMLRSFDYAAGAYEQSSPGSDASEWGDAVRRAFLEGYEQQSGRSLAEQQTLLDAFELDKALYEAVYEARNRPAWLSIPTGAISRLLDGPSE